MEDCRTIPGRASFSGWIFDGKYIAQSDMENGMEAENPGIFLSASEFCGEKCFRRSLFCRSIPAQRCFFSAAVSLRIYHIRGTVICGLYATPWNGNRSASGIICAGIRALWRNCRSRASDAAVSYLSSCIFLSCRDRVPSVLRYLEKLWPCPAEIRKIFSAGLAGFSGVYRRNSSGKLPESMDR